MKKILFVNQDILPYVAETELAKMGRTAPQKIQEAGCEIRTFMPRWGNINERRGQLHEVIRLSGLNISINDTDHPLIIKVASIAGTKVQVYFIDNDEYFTRKGQVGDDETGEMYADNAERAAFFARGVVATIKKLRWVPEVIHCQGWMSSLLPMYVKEVFADELGLTDVKVVTSIIDQPQQDAMNEDSKDCINMKGLPADALSEFNDTITSTEIQKMAIKYSDGIIKTTDNVPAEIADYIANSGARVLECSEEDFASKYIEFYDSLFE